MNSIRFWLPYFVVGLVSMLVFANSLYGAFCFDDAFALLYNGDVHHKENNLKDIFFHDFWGHDITKPDSHKSYRPITTISFRANYLTFLFFGGNETRPEHLPEDHNGSTWQPESFLVGLHLVNVILHALVSCYVYKLAQELWRFVVPPLEEQPNSKPIVSQLWIDSIPLMAGLIFATHPAHVEAVASIVGRAELLSALFCLVGFDLWRHRKSWRSTFGAIILVYISVLCKEITFAMYGVFIVWDVLKHLNTSIQVTQKMDRAKKNPKPPVNPAIAQLVAQARPVAVGLSKSAPGFHNPRGSQPTLFGQHSLDVFKSKCVKKLPEWVPNWFGLLLENTVFSVFWIVRTTLVLITIALYLYMRRALMGDSMVVQNYRRVENPLAYISNPLHLLLSMAHLHANYLWILIYPALLSCDWSYNCIHLVSSVLDPYNLYTLAAYLAVGLPVVWSIIQLFRGHRLAMPLLFCIFWGILFFTPASNIFFFVGTMLAERVLYLPSVTFCVIVPIALERAFSFLPTEKRLQVVTAICIVLIAGYSYRTWSRNVDWTDNQHLFEAAEQVCPDSAKVHFNLGILRTQQKTWSKAAFHFKRVLEIEPNYCEVNYRRALMYLGQNQYQLGVSDLHAALDCIYTRADSATALYKVYQALMEADPANAQKYANAWNAIVKKLEPVIQAEREGKRPVRQG